MTAQDQEKMSATCNLFPPLKTPGLPAFLPSQQEQGYQVHLFVLNLLTVALFRFGYYATTCPEVRFAPEF